VKQVRKAFVISEVPFRDLNKSSLLILILLTDIFMSCMGVKLGKLKIRIEHRLKESEKRRKSELENT
jgi:cell division protein FtsL